MKEFHYAFEITRKIIFNVSYYTLLTNRYPFFTTSVDKFNQPKTDYCEWGQVQEELLPEGSAAYKFYKKWDVKHLHNLTPDEYNDLCKDIERLKSKYNYVCKETDTFAGTNSYIPFYKAKELSMLKIKQQAG